jgi:hypothetical protein
VNGGIAVAQKCALTCGEDGLRLSDNGKRNASSDALPRIFILQSSGFWVWMQLCCSKEG